MKIAYIGLGKMGKNMVELLLEQGIEVVAYNRHPEAVKEVAEKGAIPAFTYKEIFDHLDDDQRIIWLMVPHSAVSHVIDEIKPFLKKEDIVIDGGNSLYENSINVDMVVQNVSAGGRETDLTFTIKLDDLKKTEKLVKNNKYINYRKLIINKNVSKVSIVGVGMVTTPGITYRMFKALAKKKINIEVISTSEIKISVLIDKKNLKKSVEILHQEFKLNNSL